MMISYKTVNTITYKGQRYVSVKDVADYVRNIAATEETDVRTRLMEAAHNIENPFEVTRSSQ